jgi:hypothetical protein
MNWRLARRSLAGTKASDMELGHATYSQDQELLPLGSPSAEAGHVLEARIIIDRIDSHRKVLENRLREVSHVDRFFEEVCIMEEQAAYRAATVEIDASDQVVIPAEIDGSNDIGVTDKSRDVEAEPDFQSVPGDITRLRRQADPSKGTVGPGRIRNRDGQVFNLGLRPELGGVT